MCYDNMLVLLIFFLLFLLGEISGINPVTLKYGQPLNQFLNEENPCH